MMTNYLTVEKTDNEDNDNMQLSTDELDLLQGGRPALFAIRRLNPDITDTNTEGPPDDSDPFEQCMSACGKLVDLLDSVTPELVTHNFMGHWADRDQCQVRLELLNRGKDKLRAMSSHVGEVHRVLEELHDSLLQQLPQLVVRKIFVDMVDIFDQGIYDKLMLVNVASKAVKAVLYYLCDCCYRIIEDLKSDTKSPGFYCGCVHNITTITCSTCGLLFHPCGLCATVRDIFKLMKAIDAVDIASFSFSDFKKEICEEGDEEECECEEEEEEEEDDITEELEESDQDNTAGGNPCVIM